MQDETVVHGLVARRAKVAGEIDHTHDLLKKLVHDLETLDAAILQFDENYQIALIKPKGFRPPSNWANRGEMARVILDILRQATEPLTTRDIALEMMANKALDTSDVKFLRMMTKRVGVALRGQRDNGFVKSEQGPGQFMLWQITKE